MVCCFMAIFVAKLMTFTTNILNCVVLDGKIVKNYLIYCFQLFSKQKKNTKQKINPFKSFLALL